MSFGGGLNTGNRKKPSRWSSAFTPVMVLHFKFRARTRGSLEVPSSLLLFYFFFFNEIEVFGVFLPRLFSSSDHYISVGNWTALYAAITVEIADFWCPGC